MSGSNILSQATTQGEGFLALGDMVEWLRSLPADQRDDFDMVEGIALTARVGRTNFNVLGPGHVDVHAHDTEGAAIECYARTIEHYRAAASPDNPVRQLMEALSGNGAMYV